MKLTDEQRSMIQAAVKDMSLADWPITDAALDSYAKRVTWWIEEGCDLAFPEEESA